MCQQLTQPCKECPWRRDSYPGYLGASDPIDFLQLEETEAHMPCHLTVDYERSDWKEQVSQAPQCAGRAIYLSNRCKSPLNKDLLKLPADPEAVFSFPQEFAEHHSRGKLTVQVLGRMIIPVEK